jgi:cbb3-type cytochrome oxidase subunit 1
LREQGPSGKRGSQTSESTRRTGKNLYSKRLGSIHFWLTNITIPVAIVLMTYATFIAGPIADSGRSQGELFSTPPITFILLAYLILIIIGFAAQLVFAYKIYKTAR